MSLPKVNVPTYTLELPSTKEEITYRPFLVKEEKILLMALQGGSTEEIVRAVKQIITNCIIAPESLNVDKLAIYDLEYIFLQIRMKSVSDKLNLRFAPRQDTECEECKKVRTIEADLNQAKVVFNDKHTKKIDIGDGIFVQMRYPGVKLVTDFDKTKESSGVEEYFRLVWECIETIHDAEKTYSTKDYTLKDGIEFLEELRQDQFDKIEEFFKTMPKLRLDVEVACKKCGFKEVFPIVGLENFFV